MQPPGSPFAPQTLELSPGSRGLGQGTYDSLSGPGAGGLGDSGAGSLDAWAVQKVTLSSASSHRLVGGPRGPQQPGAPPAASPVCCHSPARTARSFRQPSVLPARSNPPSPPRQRRSPSPEPCLLPTPSSHPSAPLPPQRTQTSGSLAPAFRTLETPSASRHPRHLSAPAPAHLIFPSSAVSLFCHAANCFADNFTSRSIPASPGMSSGAGTDLQGPRRGQPLLVDGSALSKPARTHPHHGHTEQRG